MAGLPTSMASTPGASAMSSLYQNPTSGTDLGGFISFLNRNKKKPPGTSPLIPGSQMGTATNSALFGGNLVSPALRSMLAAS